MEKKFIAPNWLLIECQIPPSNGSTLSRNNFPTQNQLLGRKVVAIECYGPQDCLNSPISNLPLVPPFIFNNCYLSLYTASDKKNGKEPGLFYDQMPCCGIRTVNLMDGAAVTPVTDLTSSRLSMLQIVPAEIDWTKSYVTIPVSGSISQPYCILFIVYYLDIGQNDEAYQP